VPLQTELENRKRRLSYSRLEEASINDNNRRYLSPEQKVTILREHLIEGKVVSDLCDKCHINPTLFYQTSDHIFSEQAHLEDFLDYLKPIIRYREWEEDPNDSAVVVGKQIWRRPIERIKPDRDYMIGPAFLFWRDTFPAGRERVDEVITLLFHYATFSVTIAIIKTIKPCGALHHIL